MGKRIIQQARGKGSFTYRVRKKAFSYKVKYPSKIKSGEAVILKILHSPAHSAPLIKAQIENEVFYNVAYNGAIENSDFSVGAGMDKEIKEGDVAELRSVPISTKIFNIEKNPGDGGKMIRTAGTSAFVNKTYDSGQIGVTMPNKKEIRLDGSCRATIGVVAGDGRKNKPFMKAGIKFYKMRAKGKLWPRVSAVSVNAVDHPFGSGRGKRVGAKIAKRNAPPGRKVGHLRPRRTGRKKR